MKKLLLTLLFIGLAIPAIAGATLWQYYQERGLSLPSVRDRVPIANDLGILDYRGTASQNEALEAYLRGYSGSLGATQRPSGYRVTLSQSLSAVAGTEDIKVSSLKTPDGHTLTDADVGTYIILTIAPGKGNEEKILCTGGTATSTNKWETCQRGFNYYNQATGTATVYIHSPGETVIISDDDAYNATVYGYLSANNTWTGTNTSTGAWIFSNANGMCLTNTNYCFRQSGGNLQWTQDGWTNSYNFTSSSITQLTASSTKGIEVTDSKIGINASSTLGMTFGSDGKLYQKTSSTKGILNDSNGIYYDYSHADTFTGNMTFSGTTTLATTTATLLTTSGLINSGNSTGTGFTHNQIITATGTSSWTRPANITKIKVKVVGGGGSGYSAATGYHAGGGGGAGGYCEKIIDVSATSSISYTVGDLVTTSTFSSYCTAGNGVNGGDGVGGSGGVATGGDINITGQKGGNGWNQAISGASQSGGYGGSSILGLGGTSAVCGSAASSPGNAGTGYGAGGGGAAHGSTGGATVDGGLGTQGIIIIEY